MTLQAVFAEALYALTGLLVLLLAATGARKAVRARQDRRRRRLEAAVRPALMQYLVDEQDDPAALAVAGRGGETTLRTLAVGLLPKLRGADRDALVSLLDSRGVLARAQRRTRRPGAVGRARAAELLGTSRASGASAELRRLLADSQSDVRIVAARALGKLGDPAAVAPLLATLEGRRPIPAGVVTMALLHIGPPAAAELRAVLGDDAAAPAARRAAAELLGLFGAVEAVPELTDVLASAAAPDIRAAAARSLGRIGLPRAVAPLIDALTGGNLELRAAAAQALGEVGGEEAVGALRAALADAHPVAHQAAQGLARQGAAGRRALAAVAAAAAPGAASGAPGVAAAAPGAAEAREALGALERRGRARRTPLAGTATALAA